MNKAILIIDCQYDFINGSLSVPHAEEKINDLASYLTKHNDEYCLKIFTMDWHPWEHCSFTKNGGKWPTHCLQYSQGAAIYEPLLEAAYSIKGANFFLRKGNFPDKEEYSIFDNDVSAAVLDLLFKDKKIDEIDICGLAGDICVAESIKSAIKKYSNMKIKVLTEFSPSIDDGTTLKEIIKNNSLEEI